MSEICSRGTAASSRPASSNRLKTTNPIGAHRSLLSRLALAGHAAYLDRVEALITAMLGDEGVRLPGARREILRAQAATQGLAVPKPVLDQLHALANS